MPKGRYMYVCRDHGSSDIELHNKKPIFNEVGNYYLTDHDKGGEKFASGLCAVGFLRYTGVKVGEGECVRMRLSAEVK